jgi:hypothetical protein
MAYAQRTVDNAPDKVSHPQHAEGPAANEPDHEPRQLLMCRRLLA